LPTVNFATTEKKSIFNFLPGSFWLFSLFSVPDSVRYTEIYLKPRKSLVGHFRGSQGHMEKTSRRKK
jgi:hypothetical protein